VSNRKLIGILCLLGGLTLMINGSYLHLKAMLGQWLISKAWQDSPRQGVVRPWPWMDTWPMAQLDVPRLQIQQIVLEGDAGQSLAFGPAHRTGSALPGETGTILISGHRDTHFQFLGQLEVGDLVVLTDNHGHRHHYNISQFQVVQAEDLLVSAEESMLVLATCWPIDAITDTDQRLVVIARPAPPSGGYAVPSGPGLSRIRSAAAIF
jgi:sortase A